MPDDCWVMRAPRLNANDDRVTLTRWLVVDHATVAAGAPIAEIETEKAAAELPAEMCGTLLHAVAAGADVPVGAPLGWRSPSSRRRTPMRRSEAIPAANARARAVAAACGVDLAAARATGATIMEHDVARRVAEHAAAEFHDR